MNAPKKVGTSWLGLEWGRQARTGERGTLSQGSPAARRRAAWGWLALGAAVALAVLVLSLA